MGFSRFHGGQNHWIEGNSTHVIRREFNLAYISAFVSKSIIIISSKDVKTNKFVLPVASSYSNESIPP